MADGDLPHATLPIVPGHEIVGRVYAVGPEVSGIAPGARVGVPWLAHACGQCGYCAGGLENLCDAPRFTGSTRDGGFATHATAEAAFVIPLDDDADPVALAPLLCAGVIGWRSLLAAGPPDAARRIGLYGFGAAAHLLAQVCRWQGREVFAFTRPDDLEGQSFARATALADLRAGRLAGAAVLVPPDGPDESVRRASASRSP